MWWGPEFKHWLDQIPWQDVITDTISWIEKDMKNKINDLWKGFTYSLRSNEEQDFFTISLWNVKWKISEIQFDGTTWETLQAVNNYIYLRIQDPDWWFYLQYENLAWYDATSTALLQEKINRAIASVRL